MQIRLNEVYDVVDHIVIVESAVTHQDRPKPLHYKENAARYARFADKIIPIALEDLLKTKPDWFTKLQSSFHMCALRLTWTTILLGYCCTRSHAVHDSSSLKAGSMYT